MSVQPRPILDNFEHQDNPFKQSTFSVSSYPSLGVTGAELDLECALKFLYSYSGSSGTYNSYRRELERLMQWAWLINKTTIIQLKREDIEAFVRFCIEPPTHWIGLKNVARFKDKNGERVINSEWRPFVTTASKVQHRKGVKPSVKAFNFSQPSIKAIFTVLSSFYSYLIQDERIDTNPVALIRQKSKFVQKDQIKPLVRRISNLQWLYCIETTELMAEDSPFEHERSLFVMNCLYSMYLRISELVADERYSPAMGDFTKDRDQNWWFQVVGKGNKSRRITVCDDMLDALKRYRRFLELSDIPTPNEQTPLIAKIRGKGPVTSTRQIRKIVQTCFDQSYQRMVTDGLTEDAEELKHATVHWLRHTGISEDVKIRPQEHVRDDAGHSSMATTDRYIDSDLRERHASAKKKRVRDV
ncbi:Tyrosine recombinase XerC [BD1-7 clade bacterium]|uniref:Tyrosine recombinase XerC n=1 Tax=BD1-7 clade bacterium TaxID=2029982 RepID=A0A5S9QMK5_9GAMM|nr:Tyrosine recombinase XerC [BD1-7 clade bacterium]